MHDICIVEVYSLVHKKADDIFHGFDFSRNCQQTNFFGIEKVHEIAGQRLQKYGRQRILPFVMRKSDDWIIDAFHRMQQFIFSHCYRITTQALYKITNFICKKFCCFFLFF